MSTPSEPSAPDSLPKYLADGLPKQNRATLEDIRAFVDELIEHKQQLDEQPIQEENLSGDVEVVEESPKGTVYKEYRTCGDESCHCMSGGEKHGPYKYRAKLEDGTVKKEYLGKVE